MNGRVAYKQAVYKGIIIAQINLMSDELCFSRLIIIAWRLVSAKPLSESMLPLEQTSVKS